MSGNVVDISSAKRRYTAPLMETEKRMFGVDAERDPETGFIFERGSGALPKAAQTELFKRQLADPEWVKLYVASDPHALIRHPELAGRT